MSADKTAPGGIDVGSIVTLNGLPGRQLRVEELSGTGARCDALDGKPIPGGEWFPLSELSAVS